MSIRGRCFGMIFSTICGPIGFRGKSFGLSAAEVPEEVPGEKRNVTLRNGCDEINPYLRP